MPVRAVADALGKAVYWDGPNYTVYLGHGEPLTYPTKELNSNDNIGDSWHDSQNLKDNYGNIYSSAITTRADNRTFETLCSMKYSRLKGTIYVSEGYSMDNARSIVLSEGRKKGNVSGTVKKNPVIETLNVFEKI